MIGYARQANIANGPQQVNNAAEAKDASHAREDRNQESKQLKHKDSERLDTGTTSTVSKADLQMETMGKIDGSEDGCGQSEGIAECQ